MNIVHGLFITLSYLIGNFSPGWLVVRCRGAGDVRDQGSGATGATNVARVLGRSWFFPILVLDTLKGALAIGIPFAFFGNEAGPGYYTACGLAVIAGHIWPVLLGFRGGKGIGTFIGVWLAMGLVAPTLPLTLLGPVLGGLLLLPLGQRPLVSALLALPLQPLLLWLLTGCFSAFLLAFTTTAIILYAHRSNLKNAFLSKRPPS